MNKKRIKQYKKILRIQEQKIETIKQQMSRQKQQLDAIEQKQKQLDAELNQIQSDLGQADRIGLFFESSNQAMILIQQKSKAIQNEITDGRQKLAELLNQFREQNRQVKSWEKLVEQESLQIRHAEMLTEMNLADERYLSTQHAGDQP